MNKRNSDLQRRCRLIRNGRRGEGPVVYWMSRDQRVSDNWALLWAQEEARIRSKGLLVLVCLVPEKPGGTGRQRSFMIGGLDYLSSRLRELNLGFVAFDRAPEEVLPPLLTRVDAHALVTDFEPLHPKQRCLDRLGDESVVPIFEVDAHNIIPAWTVTDKKEYAAYTIRPKINRLRDDFLTDIRSLERHHFDWDGAQAISDLGPLIDGFKTLARFGDEHWPHPGELEALKAAEIFVSTGLENYASQRNDPCAGAQSGLSPYLHFGHLSPQRLAFMVKKSGWPVEITEEFLEELIVRRELADNFCLHEPGYQSFEGFPDWAKKTLDEHRNDRRQYIYALEELESAQTHEPLWNACQIDLVQSGKLHGYLRMYWAKKILEWTRDPETALKFAITLNDRYSLDGCDPNGYAGIAWSIGGVHDRAWKERPVFGKIRYMNEAGCRRKFDTAAYRSSVLQNYRKV